MSWLTAAIFLLLPAIAIVARRSGGSWYSPAAFFAAFWSVFGGLPLVASPISVPPTGMLFIAGACGAVFAGGWAARRLRPAIAGPGPALNEPPLLGWFIVACTFLGVVVVVLIIGTIGSVPGPPRDLSFSGVVGKFHDLAIARNAGTWQEPAIARVLTTAAYLGAMLSGLMIAIRQTGSMRWLSLAVVLPSVTITIMLTTKASLLIPIVLGASSYLATCVATGRPPTLTWKRTVWLVGVIAVLSVAFVLVQMVRYAGWSSGQPLAVIQLLWLDSFPYLGVFSAWFQSNALSVSLHPALGQYTFAGAFELLHIHSRVAGVYTEQVSIGGSTYNIYTAFRGFIEDFTVPGALLFLGAVGFGAELAYRRIRSGDLVFMPLLAAFYATTLWSFVVNIFMYNSIVMTFVILFGYLAVASRPRIKNAVARLHWSRPGSDLKSA